MCCAVSTPAFVLYDSTVFLVYLLSIFAVLYESNGRAPIDLSFRYSPSFTNRIVAPLNTNTIISNERRLRTHTHKDPLTALAIGVSSSVDLSVGEQERAEAAPKETSFELAEACCAYRLYLRYSRNLPYSPNQTPPFFSVYSNLTGEGRRDGRSPLALPLIFADFRSTETLSCPVCVVSVRSHKRYGDRRELSERGEGVVTNLERERMFDNGQTPRPSLAG